MAKFEARRGLYFEEFEAGQQMSTVGRTITEADVVNFAGVSGDYNLIHTDLSYSEDSLLSSASHTGCLCCPWPPGWRCAVASWKAL